jgi:amino acid transporter
MVSQSPPEENKKTVFLRDATGLVKNASFLDAISINMADLSVGSAIGIVGLTMVLLPTVAGVNLVYGSIIAWLLMIPQVIVYTMMSNRIARTGGDYIWLSRSLGGFIGSTISFMGPITNVFAYLAIISLSVVFAIGSVGVALGNLNYLGLSLPGNTPGSEPLYQFLVAAVIFGVLILMNILKPKLGFKFITAAVIIGIVTLVLSDALILGAGRAGVVNYMNILQAEGSGTNYTALASSYSGPTFNLGATISILPFFAIFIYPFVNASPVVGSEIKGKNSVSWAIPIASVITVILATSSFAILYFVGGLPFTNAALSNPTLVFNYSFNLWTLAMGVANNTYVAAIIGFGWIIWSVAILAFGIVLFSRYAIAQAFDRYLPASMGYVSPRYSSPIIAHVIDLVVTLTLVGLVAFFYGPLSSLGSAIVASMFFFAFVGAGAVVYALRYDKGRSRAILAIFGVLDAIIFVYVSAQFFVYPSVYGGTALSYGYVAATFVIGAIIYFAAKSYHAKRGVDIALAFKEIPPE